MVLESTRSDKSLSPTEANKTKKTRPDKRKAAQIIPPGVDGGVKTNIQ